MHADATRQNFLQCCNIRLLGGDPWLLGGDLLLLGEDCGLLGSRACC